MLTLCSVEVALLPCADFLQILEERYKNEKKMQQALQSRILELQAEVELRKKQPGRGQSST